MYYCFFNEYIYIAVNHVLAYIMTYVLLLKILDLENIKTHHWSILPCSAMTGKNLLEGIDWILDDISSRIFTMD